MLTLKCPKHPYYTGQRSPKASCDQCQVIELIRIRAEAAKVEVKP